MHTAILKKHFSFQNDLIDQLNSQKKHVLFNGSFWARDWDWVELVLNERYAPPVEIADDFELYAYFKSDLNLSAWVCDWIKNNRQRAIAVTEHQINQFQTRKPYD